jgi:hypothetical protein
LKHREFIITQQAIDLLLKNVRFDELHGLIVRQWRTKSMAYKGVWVYTVLIVWYYEEEYRVIRVVAEGKRPAGAHGHIERSPRSAGFGTAQANELMC